MERAGAHDADQVQMPSLIGMAVRQARDAGHRAGVVVVSADLGGPPLGVLTWPGVWTVTAQRPAAGAWVPRWGNVAIDFEERHGGGAGGDREPRIPPACPSALAAEAEPPDKSTSH